ncbi:MAG TPA: glycoside hydrolase family 88 protein [Opitutaceae bacterium]|nr:glycoside hydrolase family 88 protein [Opitutaceae bacterium]
MRGLTGLAAFLVLLAPGAIGSHPAAEPGPAITAPADGATNVPINVTLAWAPVAGATGYDVYFGAGDTPSFQCRVATPTFLLETLTTGTTYRWRVAAIMDGGATSGALRSFTTAAHAGREAMFAWPIRIANSVRTQYPEPASLRNWNYTEGMIIDALYAIAVRTGRTGDFDFIRAWLDRFVAADGTIDREAYPFELFSLDRVRPGSALLWMYDRTREEKYLKAAYYVASQLDRQPRTSDGGYWHRSTYPNQMWLDGIYMADVFSAEFAARTNQSKYFDDAVRQIALIHRHTHDPKTGLYYHGWDETRTRPWANPKTGTSPEFWGRAIGWYGMAMADVLDWLPADHPGRQEVLPIFQAYCAAVLKFQDHDTAMWWQIVDKPAAPKNYVETSCSLMFAYAMARGAQRGWLPPEYLEHARRATRGILNHEIALLPGDRMDIKGTVEVGSLGGNGGFYDYYVAVPVRTNDQKSVGAFMYLSLALSETANDTGPASRELPRRSP